MAVAAGSLRPLLGMKSPCADCKAVLTTAALMVAQQLVRGRLTYVDISAA